METQVKAQDNRPERAQIWRIRGTDRDRPDAGALANRLSMTVPRR